MEIGGNGGNDMGEIKDFRISFRIGSSDFFVG